MAGAPTRRGDEATRTPLRQAVLKAMASRSTALATAGAGTLALASVTAAVQVGADTTYGHRQPDATSAVSLLAFPPGALEAPVRLLLLLPFRRLLLCGLLHRRPAVVDGELFECDVGCNGEARRSQLLQ